MSFAIKSALLISFLFLYTIFTYFTNHSGFLSSTAGFKNFMISFVYVLIWLFVLYLGIKNNSNALLILYMIYWGLAIIYFGLYPYVIDTVFGMLWFLGSIVFLIPTLGILYPFILLRNIIKTDSLYEFRVEMIWFALFALILFAVGFIVCNRLEKLS